MLYGIRENLMGADIELREKFQRAVDLGFDGIEIIPRDRQGMHGMMVFDEDGRRELLELCDEFDLLISSLSQATWRDHNCLTTDEDGWEAGRDHLTEVIEIAIQLGADAILLPHFGPMEPSLDDPRLEWDLRGIRDAVEATAPHDIDICIECTVDLETMQGIIEMADHRQIGIYYDIGNLKASGHDPAEMILALGDGIKMIHIKEAGADLLGCGDVDMGEVADAIYDIGYDDWLVFETAPTDDPMSAMEHNFAELRKYL